MGESLTHTDNLTADSMKKIIDILYIVFKISFKKIQGVIVEKHVF